MGFTDELSSLQPGMNIGNLHIVSFIGKGAIGEVYLAQHEILGRQFAVKVIPKGFTSEEAVDGFKQAAQIQTLLDHPYIVRIDDLGEEEMFYWLRMEYVEGELNANNLPIRTLEDLMRQNNGLLTEEEVCYYLYYLLIALDHAHAQEVVHADLKPANVLLAADGVKLAELGVTNLIGHAWDDFHLLRQDPLMEPTPFDPLPGYSRLLPALLNTFEYYSPEQQAGQHATIQSNLYTVGLMAYRMLTGRRCASMDPPSCVIPEINPQWDQWMVQALAYDPECRFESAATMLQALPGLELSERTDELEQSND